MTILLQSKTASSLWFSAGETLRLWFREDHRREVLPTFRSRDSGLPRWVGARHSLPRFAPRFIGHVTTVDPFLFLGGVVQLRRCSATRATTDPWTCGPWESSSTWGERRFGNWSALFIEVREELGWITHFWRVVASLRGRAPTRRLQTILRLPTPGASTARAQKTDSCEVKRLLVHCANSSATTVAGRRRVESVHEQLKNMISYLLYLADAFLRLRAVERKKRESDLFSTKQ